MPQAQTRAEAAWRKKGKILSADLVLGRSAPAMKNIWVGPAARAADRGHALR